MSVSIRDVLDALARRYPDLELVDEGAAFKLVLRAQGIVVSVAVAQRAVEWSVDVADEIEGGTASDWYDYEGYEEADVDDLRAEMRADLERFVSLVASNPIRIAGTNTRRVLEVNDAGAWRQVVPAKL